MAEEGDIRPTLSVLVVTYANEADVDPCLDALERALDGIDAEVLVLDNASPDRTRDVLRARADPRLELLVSEENLGFAAGVNLLAARARGEHLLLLNPDTQIGEGAVRALLDVADRRPGAGLHGGWTVDADGAPTYASAWGRQTLRSLLCFATGASAAFPHTVLDPESLGRWPTGEREVDVVTGLLLLLRRETWQALAGFDEDFWLYGEDQDLGIRAWRYGLRPVVTPEAVVEHGGGASAAGAGARAVFMLRGRVTLMRKHWPSLRRDVGLVLLLAGVALRSALPGPNRDAWRHALRDRARWRAGYPLGRRRRGPDPTAPPPRRLAVVVCFLDERDHLPELLASLAAQTRLPDELLLVDDGSRDGSGDLARAFADAHPWARALRRPARPPERDRLARAGELKAWHWGVSQLRERPDVVVKLDGDLRLTPTLFERVLAEFATDPTLGITGAFLAVDVEGRAVRERYPADHVHGPNKHYRWACYEDIVPLEPLLGWDAADERKAHLAGWSTRSIALPEGDPVHLRPTGRHDGRLRAYRRWGACAWGFGAHPLRVLAGTVVRLGHRPLVLAGVNYAAGWAIAGVRRRPRIDEEARRHGRQEDLRVLRSALGRAVRRGR